MLRPAIVSTLLPSVVSAARNSGTSQACRCRVAFAACASGSAASGPPLQQRAAEHRRALRLRPALGRCATSVPGTSVVANPVAHRSQRCVGGIRSIRRVPWASQCLLAAAHRGVVATRVHSRRRRVADLRFVQRVRALTLRSTGRAGSCLDLRRAVARRAGYIQR
jgi:hypothetical protein